MSSLRLKKGSVDPAVIQETQELDETKHRCPDKALPGASVRQESKLLIGPVWYDVQCGLCLCMLLSCQVVVSPSCKQWHKHTNPEARQDTMRSS